MSGFELIIPCPTYKKLVHMVNTMQFTRGNVAQEEMLSRKPFGLLDCI
jgi:hypothetical protein